jgi:HEAT repeat protein
MAEHLFDHLVDNEFEVREFVYLILNQLGKDVADAAVRRFVAADNKFARKALGTAIIRIGHPAVPALIEVLKDNRWQVALSAITILGEIKSRDSVKGLVQTAFHMDSRLRLETIIALAKIGGREATAMLIDLLRDTDPAIRQQAIIWLGNTGNKQGLPALIQLIGQRDVWGKMMAVKKEALRAIGRIGDRSVLDILIRLVKKRHLILAGRQEEWKVLAVEIISHLGGEPERRFLERMASGSGRISHACSTAVESMKQRTSGNHE